MIDVGETEAIKNVEIVNMKHNLVIITSKNKVIRNRPGRLIRSQVIAAAKEIIDKYKPSDSKVPIYF
jgi:hypothetical protein